MIAAAIGLRTALSVQAKSTAPGSSSPLGPRKLSALQMQDAEEREEPARRVEIDLDLAFQALFQKRRAFVVQPATPHIQRFYLVGRRIADRLEVAVADEEIVFDHAAERRQGKHDATMRRAALQADVEDETVLFQRQGKPVRAAFRIPRHKTVAFEQIVNRDLAFLLDLARAAHERALVQ